jgi:hypothetical protein
MRLDIRLPIGMLFSICGILLVLFGALSNRQLYERSLNINVNLWWGLAMLVFGMIMLALGRSHKQAGPVTGDRGPVRPGGSH